MKALLLFLVAVTCNAAGLNFPTVRYSVSPDFRWLVRCVIGKRADGFQHTVLLSRFGEITARVVCISNRSCDVLWAEDTREIGARRDTSLTANPMIGEVTAGPSCTESSRRSRGVLT